MDQCKNLARVIYEMHYGPLREVAGALSQMCEDNDVRTAPKTTEDYAELLYDWAESVVTDT